MNRMRMLAFVFSVFAALLSAAVGHAQGTSNAFPDPISSREIDNWAQWLDFSPLDRLSIDPFHEEYRERFRQLRDGKIEDYLKSSPANAGAMTLMSPPDRKVVEDRVKARTEILRDIERLDTEFIQKLKGLAAKGDSGVFETIDLAARRHRAKGVIGGMYLSTADADLAEFYRKVEDDNGNLSNAIAEMPDALHAQLVQALRDYERTLTGRLEAISKVFVKSPVATLDALERNGVQQPNLDPANPPSDEAFRAWFEARQTARNEALKEATELRSQIAKSNRTFLMTLKGILPDIVWREVRSQFLKRSYNEAWPDRQSAEPAFEQAESVANLSEEDRAAIRNAREAWQTAHDAATETMLDAIDDFRRGNNSSMFFFGDTDWKSQSEKMGALQRARESVNDLARGQIQQVVGDRISVTADKPKQRFPAGIQFEAAEMGGEGAIILDSTDLGDMGAQVVVTMDGSASRLDDGDQFLPGPISTADLDHYAELLQLESELQPVVNALLDDYRASFKAAREDEMSGLNEFAGGGPVMVHGEGRPPAPPTPQEIDKLYSARKSAWDRLQRLDQEFLDSIESIAGPAAPKDAMSRVRSARLRDVLNRSGRGGGAFSFSLGRMSPSRESGVDLVELTGSSKISEASKHALDPALSAYELAFIETLRKRRDIVMSQQKEIDKFHAGLMKVGEDGDVSVQIDDQDEGFKQMQEAQRKIEAATEAVGSLNRATADTLISQLSGEDQLVYRRAYQRAAFPSLYRDQGNAEPALMAALDLDDLTPEQLASIDEILKDHRLEYDRICDEMVRQARDNLSGNLASGPFDGGGFRAMQEMQNSLKKLKFDRSELSASSLRRLKAVLTPEQAQRVPAMDETKRNQEKPDGPIFISN